MDSLARPMLSYNLVDFYPRGIGVAESKGKYLLNHLCLLKIAIGFRSSWDSMLLSCVCWVISQRGSHFLLFQCDLIYLI